MKGLKIERAKPSNVIDIYALLKAAVPEKILPGAPTERQLKAYYVTLLRELASPHHIFFVAKRGRGFLGFAHAVAIPGRWDGIVNQVIVDLVYVSEHRRKNGIGRKLLDEIKKEVENMGITKVAFSCPLLQMEYWAKERGAKATQVEMEITL